MKILTIGQSPTLLNQYGRIHKTIIEELSQAELPQDSVESLVWNHDIEYFLPTETNQHFYHTVTGPVKIHPFLDIKGQLPVFTFETMKKTQPQVVITIGEYYETEFVSAIKSLYGHLFKWIAIVPLGEKHISEDYGLNLSYADVICVTTKQGTQAIKNITGKGEYIPFGIDSCTNLSKPDGFKLLCMGKNTQSSNLSVLIDTAASVEIETTLHTNVHDLGGDYNLPFLIKKTGKSHLFSLPKRFVSLRDGYTQEEINQQYKSHHLIVDCSLQSVTGLTILEGMANGCIPVGMECGAIGEIMAEIPDQFRFMVEHIDFTIQRSEKACIINPKDLNRVLKNIKSMACDKQWLNNASNEVIGVAEKFSKEFFIKRIKETVEKIVTSNHSIAVDSFNTETDNGKCN